MLERHSGGVNFDKLGEGLSGLAKTAAGFALGGIALNIGGDIAEQFKEVLTGTVDLGREVRRLQLDVGGSAESISGLLAVFHRFGVEGEGAEKTLSLFSRGLRGDITATEASTQNAKSFAGTLAELGVESTDAQGHLRPMDQVLLEVADGFKAHTTDGQNAARAMALFGRSGRDLVPILSLGREGILELEDEAKKLGLTLSQDNVDGVRQFVKAQKDMNESIEGVKVQLGKELLPIFTELAVAAAKWSKSLNGEVGKNLTGFMSGVGKTIEVLQFLQKVTSNPLGVVIDMAKDPNSFGRQFANTAVSAITGRPPEVFGPSAQSLLHADRAVARTEAAAKAAADKTAADQAAAAAQVTLAKQKERLDAQIAAGEREQAIIQHQIALKTRESLDLKRSEAEVQLQMLPLKAQQANIEQQLLIASDKRASLERDAAVTRAQMAANASADALEGADFEERRLRAKIKADAIGGRGVSPTDIGALTRLALSKPELELGALVGGRGATLAERERQRAQQQQDLATLPLREKQAEIEQSVASLNAQSAEVQRKIEEARLHGVVDTTDLQKKKEALDDALFAKNQQKADLEGKGIVLNITQHITSSGEVDYDKIIEQTYQGVLSGLSQAQRTVGLPAPPFQPGSRTGASVGVTGPF